LVLDDLRGEGVLPSSGRRLLVAAVTLMVLLNWNVRSQNRSKGNSFGNGVEIFI
jgi:hypothetical protein